jgi:hypothetical protein
MFFMQLPKQLLEQLAAGIACVSRGVGVPGVPEAQGRCLSDDQVRSAWNFMNKMDCALFGSLISSLALCFEPFLVCVLDLGTKGIVLR